MNKIRLIDADALKEEINSEIAQATKVEITVDADYLWSLLNYAIDNAPTVEPTFKPIAEVKFDKEQLQEIVDKAKAEVLASVERPHGEWIKEKNSQDAICSVCKGTRRDNRLGYIEFCNRCGADMRKGESE